MSSSAPLVYFDTNIFIAAYESMGAVSDHACWLMEAVERREIGAATSELTLAEMLCKPARDGDWKRVEGYEELFRSSAMFQVSPVERHILIESAFLRARVPALRLPDAIHLATAQAMNCAAMVSNDARLSGGKIQVHKLGPFTLDNIRGGRS